MISSSTCTLPTLELSLILTNIVVRYINMDLFGDKTEIKQIFINTPIPWLW